jgi:hypothetical protein
MSQYITGFIMKSRLFLITFAATIAFSYTVRAQFLDDVRKIVIQDKGGLTEQDAVSGIKEALVKGTSESVKIVSKMDGYFANPQIKIPFPEDAKAIESKLRAIGLGNKVDEVVLSLNRAAEDAAKGAETVFVSAVKNMSISDAIQIVRGNNDAATQYLSRTTSPVLRSKFRPLIQSSLDKVDATRLWADVINTYNQIPFVTKQNPDLAGYVTDKAIAGLFVMIAKEELKIRQNPVARTTEILRKVFGN